MSITLVAAIAHNGVIGRNNGLPWHLPEDLRHFKRVTLGKPIIMGRATYESIGRPLPGRTNIVVTRNPEWRADGVASATSLDAALCSGDETMDRMIIGGASLYAQVLPQAERIYLTQVHADVPGDTRFPMLDMRAWREVEREDFPQTGAANRFGYSFVTLERRQQRPVIAKEQHDRGSLLQDEERYRTADL